MISLSTQNCQITSDVALSKKPPSPKLNLTLLQERMYNFISLLSGKVHFACLRKICDVVCGIAALLKTKNKISSKLKEKTANPMAAGSGTSGREVISMYRTKVVPNMIPATSNWIVGALTHPFCRTDSS